jgi:hypothetical protein
VKLLVNWGQDVLFQKQAAKDNKLLDKFDLGYTDCWGSGKGEMTIDESFSTETEQLPLKSESSAPRVRNRSHARDVNKNTRVDA